VLQDLARKDPPEVLQVGGEVLDLFREHRADGKDPAHAERLAEVP